jgi:hypothetical protein
LITSLGSVDPIKAMVLSSYLMVGEQLNLLLELTLPDVTHLDLESENSLNFALEGEACKGKYRHVGKRQKLETCRGSQQASESF